LKMVIFNFLAAVCRPNGWQKVKIDCGGNFSEWHSRQPSAATTEGVFRRPYILSMPCTAMD